MESSVLIHNTDPERFLDLIKKTVEDALRNNFKGSTQSESEILLTKKETANRLRISEPTLNRLLADRKIRGLRLNRRVLFRLADVDACLQEISNRKPAKIHTR